MNAREFSAALGEIDPKYVAEAMTYQRKNRTRAWVKWSAAAACLVAVIAAAWNLPGLLPGGPKPPILVNPVLTIQPSEFPEQGTPPADQTAAPYTSAAAEPNLTPPETEEPYHYLLEYEISMSGVTFNALDNALAAGMWWDPEKYETVTWDYDAIMAYYGREMIPAGLYVPEGLTPDMNRTLQAVVSKEDGSVVMDAFHLGFYEIFGTWEDGEPRTIGYDIPAPHGFNIAVSKVGLLTDCIYILPENEVKTTNIGGVELTFGYRAMAYGPYDRSTHTPAGYYDFVEADFTLDGAGYQLHFYQMDRSEVVKVVASLILGTQDITITE